MKKVLAIIFSFVATAAFADAAPDASAPLKPFELSYNEAEEAIGWVLTQKGAGDKIAATILGHKNNALFAFTKPVSVDIRGIQFDKQTSHWSASLLFVSEGQVVSAIPASGHFDEMVELPVLKHPMRSGEVIMGGDLEVRDYPTDHSRSDTVTDMASLIGKSPLRSISPYRPIRGHEIAAPAIIKKNALVQVHYNTPGMEITTSGQAMTDGSKGQVISVRNVASKRVIEAIVTSDGSVDVLPTSSSASTQDIGALYAAN